MKTLNKLRDEIHENAVRHGFYEEEDKINKWVLNSRVAIRHALFAQKIASIHSELSEVLEADITGRPAKLERVKNLKPEHVNPEYNFNDSWKNSFEANVKDTVPDELADVIIRVLDLCGHLNIDIEKHVELKMKYNELREYKHGKIIEQ